MNLLDTLKKTGLPIAYFKFSKLQTLPFIVYRGNGQNSFAADDTYLHKVNTYIVEYYFDRKNEALEADLEKILLEDSFNYEKSPDVYIQSEDIYVIYFYI